VNLLGRASRQKQWIQREGGGRIATDKAVLGLLELNWQDSRVGAGCRRCISGGQGIALALEMLG
jgi:hypothetical protein